MRKTLTLFNGLSGLINRVVSMIFLFCVRHYFTKYLDVEYLGFEGLFSNILGLFSLVDLGLGNAISFNLYEPLHNQDRTLISSIMAVYKKLYLAVGIIIFVLALCFSPFILFFIKDYTLPENTIRLYFLVYAMSVSITYFFSYKRTLIFALQKNYIVMNIDSVTKIKLKKHVKALAVTNISWQGVSSTDNIIISSMIGVIDLAKNANYSIITMSINNIVATVLGGVSASIGDLIVEGDTVKIKKYFDRYCFIYCIVSSYAALGVYFVSAPLITIWVGKRLVFSQFPVFLIAVSLFLTLNFRPLAEYQNYSGNFVYYKPYSIVAVIINIAASIVFAYFMGISGVFLGTTITYCFMISTVVSILYKKMFKSRQSEYYKKSLINFLPALISFVLLCLLKNYLPDSLILQILLMITFITIIYFLMVILILKKTQDFCFFEKLIKQILCKVIIKK